MTESLPLVPVPVGACRCPGEPHADGDVVFLYPKLGLAGGIATHSVIQMMVPGPARLAAIYEALFDHGIGDWTFSNGTGAKIPISPATVRGALPWLEGGSTVASELLALHGQAILSPFADQKQKKDNQPPKRTPTTKSSRRGPTSVTST